MGIRTIDLHIPGCRSLKEKRFVIKSLRDRLRSKFNISVAEIDHQDLWQRSKIAIAAVNESGAYIDGVLQRAMQLVDNERRVVIIDINTEMY